MAFRPKFEKYFPKADISDLFKYFDEFGEIFDVHSNIDLCRDGKDNFLALDAKADYLVTGDEDLLILKSVENTVITTLSDFLKNFE